MSGRTLVLEGSSAARIVLKDAVAETVHISASSASMMALSGSCDAAVVQISSAAMVSGSGLVCVDLTVEASSAARALLFASGEVTASASSGARVELTGNPLHVEDEVGSGADVVVPR
jgi:hypothetical protein